MSSSGPTQEAITLQWVLGANSVSVFALHPAAPSTGSDGGHRIVYISGNVGVIYDSAAKTQTLLRGHRNPLKALVVDDTKRLIATACTGAQSSIIFWDAGNGLPIGMIESPHAGGTSAMAFTPDGRYLATLSVPSTATDALDGSGVQEVAIWDCGSVWSSLGVTLEGYAGGGTEEGEEGGGAPAPRLCSSAVVPCADAQTSLTVSRQGAPATLTVGSAEAMRDGAVLASVFEMCTCGTTSVVFWAVTRCTVKDADAGAKAGRGGAGGGTTKLRTGPAQYATKDLWAIACDAPTVPGVEHGRLLSQTVFVPGARADHLSTIDVMAAESKAQDAALDAGSSMASMGTGARSVSPTRKGVSTQGSSSTAPAAKRGLHDPLGSVMLKAPTGAVVTAVTGTSEGMLLQWQSNYRAADAETALVRGLKAGPGSGFASAAAVVVRRSCLKAVKLTAPEFVAIGGAVPAAKPAHASRINALRVTPCGSRVVAGTEDGAVRVYDLNMRLVGWFEDLQAGPVSALDFVPGTTAAELTAAGVLMQPGLPVKRTLACVPDIVLSTGRCLMLAIHTAAFDTVFATDEVRKGSVLLEGPDAPVTGLAAYPHVGRLAVAVASGVLQVWDTSSKALLVLRELTQPPDQEAYMAGRVQVTQYYHPTSLAVDPLGRFVAVGTAEGYLLILNPDDLSDVQAAIPPPEFPRPGHPVNRLTFSPDGYHLAAADTARHVTLFRFVRQKSRRLATGLAQTTAVQRLSSRRPWETVIPEADRFEEVVLDSWQYIGRVKGHSQAITGLSFSHLPPGAAQHPPGLGMDAVPGMPHASFWAADTQDDGEVAGMHIQHGLAQLASVGSDRRLCLYDVGGASVAGGVPVRHSRSRSKVELDARPSAAFWLPPRGTTPVLQGDYAASDTGMSLVLPSDAFKLKVWNVEGVPSVARTALAPTFGGAITHTALLLSKQRAPAAAPHGGAGENKKEDDEAAAGGVGPGAPYAIAYATNDRIVGIARLPLDGSPFSYMGVVGHTGPVAAMSASADGRHVFSAGLDSTAGGGASGADMSVSELVAAGSGSVCIWTVDEDAVHAASAEGGSGLAPFTSLLDGGASGRQYSDICDLFSYAQIRAQGESSTAPRKAGVDLPTSELTAVMRGLGYFPTSEASDALVSEARASMAESRAGGGVDPSTASDTVDLQTMIRLFVNHRPVRPPVAADVRAALSTISTTLDASGDTDPSGGMRWGGLARLLSTHGERVGFEELTACITGLLGVDTAATGGAPVLDDEDVLTPEDVATKILGMQG